MKAVSFWVGGNPATWATKSEEPWKEQLLRQTPSPSLNREEVGLRMRFILPTLRPWGQPLDVDNLCEPVFAILVDKVGWFKGSRSNIGWWQATKVQGSKSGCQFSIYIADDLAVQQTIPDYDHIYSGTIPRNARSPEQIRWAWQMRELNQFSWIPQSCDMILEFAYTNIDIGNISNYGVIKPTIDCLYPWLGGKKGQPDDHRIMNLGVSKSSTTSDFSGVRIRMWARGRINSQLKNQANSGAKTKKSNIGLSQHPRGHVKTKNITNPCIPGSRKWIVCEGALAEKTILQVQSDLENSYQGSGRRFKEYISDLRTENKLDIIIEDGRLICSGYRG